MSDHLRDELPVPADSPEAAAYRADAEALATYAEALRADESSLGIADAVMARLGDERPGAAPLAGAEPEAVLLRPAFGPPGLLAVAAVLLLGIGLALVLGLPVQPDAVETAAPEVTPPIAPVAPEAPVAVEPVSTQPLPRRDRPTLPSRQRRARPGIVPVDSESRRDDLPAALLENLLQGLSPGMRGRFDRLPPLEENEREVKF